MADVAKATPAWRIFPLGALGYSGYRQFMGAGIPTVLGELVRQLGQFWLAWELTHSRFFLGLVGLSAAIPAILLGFVAGAVADRMEKRVLLVPVQLFIAASMLGLFTLAALDLAEPWHVIVFAALSGAGQTFYVTARQALMPEVVDRKELPSGVALDTSVWQGSRVFAPAIAGPLIEIVGVATCFLFTAIGSLIGAKATALIQTDGSTPGGTREKGWKAFSAGLEYVRRSTIFSTIIAISLTVTLLGSGFIILLPSFADEVFDNGARGYTIMQLTFGAGALLGTLLMASLAHIEKRGRLLFISTALLGVVVAAFALSENFPLSLALLSIAGIIYSVYINCSATLIMVLVPDEIRGRVLAVYSFTWFLLPLGGFVSGSMAAATTTPIAVAIGGGMVTAISIILAAAVPQVRRL